MDPRIEKLLKDLHLKFLRQNPYDEGDLLYYRINYRLADSLQCSLAQAEDAHQEYHASNPRHVSGGFCDSCSRLVRIVPIIYGYDKKDADMLQKAQAEGRLILCDMDLIVGGARLALFGCAVCKKPLDKYGTA
ncbi:MAG: hypothetical protein ABI361_03440 [Nitrososphaera sp.]|jgi:hypothetical protein